MELRVPKIGVNVFVLNEGKLLLGKRKGKRGYGTWSLPGGHFEYGESFTAAAKRELEEETGIKAEALKFVQLINQPLNDSHYVHINFLAKTWHGVPRCMEPNKFSEWRWFDLTNIPANIFIGHKQFFPALLDTISYVDD